MISADEEFVREHWVGQDPIEVFLIDDPMPEFCSASVRIRGFGPCFYRSTQEEAWAAAAEFTRERLKDIAALELAVETAFCPDSENNHCATCELTMPLRKLAIAALEKLKMGMR